MCCQRNSNSCSINVLSASNQVIYGLESKYVKVVVVVSQINLFILRDQGIFSVIPGGGAASSSGGEHSSQEVESLRRVIRGR